MGREEQIQIREVLRDTIKLLCKNGLKYSTEFSVEGLLGITVDNQEIFLVNINETFSQPDRSTERIQHTQDDEQHQSAYPSTSPRSSITYSPYNRNSFGRRTMGYSYSGLKKMRQRTNRIGRNRPPKVWLTDISDYAHATSAAASTVSSSRKEYAASRDFANSNSTERSGTGSRDESQSETSGEEALQRLADCVGRISSDSPSQCSSSNKETLLEQEVTEDDLTKIKEEILSDSEIVPSNEVEVEEFQAAGNDSNSSRKQHDSKVERRRESKISVDTKVASTEPSASMSWFSPSEGAGVSVFPIFGAEASDHATVTGGSVMPPLGLVPQYPVNFKDSPKVIRGGRFIDVEVRDPSKEAECEYAAVRAPGCIVIPRILCRAKGFKVGNVMNAMKSMTRHRDDPLYIGEYKQISGNMKTFYKCPPDLIKDEALAKYDLTREVYTSLYYQNPRPKLGGPVNWANYVEILMRHMPVGPEYYPVESMGLSEAELADLQLKQSNSSKLDNSDYYACIPR